MERPDIIVITVDGLRTDALGAYGGRLDGLEIDAFAATAQLFENHYATATSTLMSLYSWYTGLPAYRMPIRDLATATLPLGTVNTLGEVLGRRGYSMLNTVEVRCGLPDQPTPERVYRSEPILSLCEDPPFPLHFPGRPDYPLLGIAEACVPYALDWFRRTPPPRFLHLWLTDLHVYHRHPAFRAAAGLTEPEPRYRHENPVVCRYYDLVRMVDADVGRLLREVEEVSRHAVLVVTADHGEALGERPAALRDAEWFATDGRQYDHGYPQQIEQNLIRTPLVVKLPGQRPGTRVQQLVSALDLYDSLLELSADAEHTASLTGSTCTWMNALEGRGRDVAVSETRWLFEADRSAALLDDAGWKLVRHPGPRHELFFLPDDPGEERDLWNRAAAGRALADRLDAIESDARRELAGRPWWELPK